MNAPGESPYVSHPKFSYKIRELEERKPLTPIHFLLAKILISLRYIQGTYTTLLRYTSVRELDTPTHQKFIPVSAHNVYFESIRNKRCHPKKIPPFGDYMFHFRYCSEKTYLQRPINIYFIIDEIVVAMLQIQRCVP